MQQMDQQMNRQQKIMAAKASFRQTGDNAGFFGIDSIELNKDSIYTGYCRIFCKYKCHSIDYYPSGAVKSEGYMVCDEDFMVDFWEIGEWKYYDEAGNLIKTEDYGNL